MLPVAYRNIQEAYLSRKHAKYDSRLYSRINDKSETLKYALKYKFICMPDRLNIMYETLDNDLKTFVDTEVWSCMSIYCVKLSGYGENYRNCETKTYSNVTV